MAAPKRALFLIRTAMITGVLAMAVAVIVTRRQGAVTAATDRADTLRMMASVAALIAGIALIAMRTRLSAVAPSRDSTMRIIAWASGEFAAIFGLVAVLLTGADAAAAPGLTVFALSLVLFPVPRD
ncbi:MAG: hypothetical protein NTZ43_10920 [Gemmatimonadetes bacterium]|nr:hypothetical protein [Gemmatimonadota bacterium]